MSCRIGNESFIRIPAEVARVVHFQPRFGDLGLPHLRGNWTVRLADGRHFFEAYGLSTEDGARFMDFCVCVANGVLPKSRCGRP